MRNFVKIFCSKSCWSIRFSGYLVCQEMPGHGLSQVKCEPQSDEEDSDPQFAHTYLNSQVTVITSILIVLHISYKF